MNTLVKSALRRAAFFALVAAAPGFAQSSQRGQPTTPFAATDFAKLKWLEGTWRGNATGQDPFYERYHFVNDSTIEISYFRDSTLTRESGTGRVYLTVGRIFHTTGPGRWGATRVDSSGIYFIPQVNARNTFAWTYQSGDTWTATLRSGATGRETVTIYEMKRMRTP
jgi:hypothetical protein